MREAGREAPSTTREAILAAAGRRYARFGARKTTMGEVARAAGCSRATLYHHFPGKDALYSGLLEREIAEFLVEIEAVAASARGARRKLRAIVETTARLYARPSALGEALAGDAELAVETVAAPAVAAYEERVIAVLSGVLEEGVAAGDFRALDAGATAYLMYHLGRVLVTRELAGRGDYALAHILSVMDDLVARGIARRNPR